MASIDSDVATVLALAQRVNDLRKAFEAAQPAIKRLEKANYPGVEMVAHHLDSTEDRYDGGLLLIAEHLAMMREAAGDPAAYDYEFYATSLDDDLDKLVKISPDEAAKEMVQNLGTDVEALERIKAMRTYAATVA